MKYLIAADAGGTKMDTVLFNDQGEVLLRDISLGCNPMDIGMEEARQRAFQTLRRVAARSPERVSAIYAAIAGTYYFHEDLLTEELLGQLEADKIHVDDDGRCLISSVLPQEEDGCGMICGTGCSIWVRREGMELFHLGGWGYLVDTRGSGFILGRDAFRAVCLAEDGCGEKTVLTELVARELGEENPRWAIPLLYTGGRRRIASLAYTVFEGARLGDKVSQQILDQGAEDMARLLRAADRYFDKPYPVVAGGGIIASFPEYGEAIRRKAPPRAKLIVSRIPPVYGGAVEAMRDCGLTCGEAFQARFLESYRQSKESG